MSSFHSSKRIISFNLLSAILLFCIAVNAVGASQEMADAASCIRVYKASDNSVTRRQALNALDEVVTRRGMDTPKVVKDILLSALNDKSPVVVATAVDQVGKFELHDLSERLINLYNNADKMFQSAYADRVKFSIVPALGKSGGNGVASFLSDLLAEDNGSVMGEYILLAMKELHDISLVDDVKKYKTKMEGLVRFAKAKNHDPLMYSRKLMYIDLALDVENSLVSKGGK